MRNSTMGASKMGKSMGKTMNNEKQMLKEEQRQVLAQIKEIDDRLQMEQLSAYERDQLKTVK